MYNIFGFYKFKKFLFLKKNKILLEDFFIKNNIRGTLIISKEGINGTISGKKKNIYLAKKKIKNLFKISYFDSENISKSKFQPFHRPKVKIKKEVVPMGTYINLIKKRKGRYIKPEKWNILISDKKTLLLDARKPFEHDVGSFKKAINPKVKHFRDFPKYLNKLDKAKKIAMFCTGGIRCEKASVYMEQKGFKNVYQLKGGILNYLKKVNIKDSLWRGECYVFDNRISLKHKLRQGTFSMCSGCRTPISKQDKKSNKYEKGVSCPNCHDSLTNSQKLRFRMRQNQINLAKKSRSHHIFQKEY